MIYYPLSVLMFAGIKTSALILGDNIYYGHGMAKLVGPGRIKPTGATVFAYHVNDPHRHSNSPRRIRMSGNSRGETHINRSNEETVA
jgi:dTDP-glucose pyrophosphorylase